MAKPIPGKYYTLFSLLFWMGMYGCWLWFNSKAMPSLLINILFTLTDFIFFAGLSLITSQIFIPRLLYRKHYIGFFSAYAILLIAGTTMMLLVNFWILQPYRSATANAGYWTHYVDLSGSYMLSFFLTTTTASFKLAADWYSSQQVIDRLSEEKLKAELEFLNMQVNPHSFFNVLNTIYFLVDLDSEKAKKTILQFSDIFRYQLYECNGDKTVLEKEIQFLETYISLQRSRYDDDYRISFTPEVSEPGIPVAPFLFLPLVENAFKHVSNHINQPNTIEMYIKATADKIYCRVTNSYNVESPLSDNGLGLVNLKRRLALQYEGNYQLSMDQHEGIHTAGLTIHL